MSSFIDQVEQVIRDEHLFPEGTKALVAVSGGVDSMVLMHVLATLAPRYHWKLHVLHVNHGLRDEESDQDEALVQWVAGRSGCPFTMKRVEVLQAAEHEGISIEMAARTLRHDACATVARNWGTERIALAHHSDDQLELFFIRLLRGTGSTGAAGMALRSPSPSDPKLQIIRPLLPFSKQDLLSYAKQTGLVFREDHTNRDPSILRNRIRHELLPLLRTNYSPALDRHVRRWMELAGAESELSAMLAREWRRTGAWAGKPCAWEELPTAVQRAELRQNLLALRIVPHFELIEFLRRHPDRWIMPQNGVFLAREEEGRLRHKKVEKESFSQEAMDVALPPDCSEGFLELDDLRIQWERTSRESVPVFRGRPVNEEWLDADRVGTQIRLRHWRPGDRMQPLGMNHLVKLQDLFVNEKIPRALRRRKLLAESASGEIFWVEDLRIGDAFKVKPDTAQVLHWQWKRSGT